MLEGKRILVLEDEFLIALDVADALAERGAIIVGPAHRIDAALDLIGAGGLDAALLDVNIGGQSSGEVADVLREAGIPFVFATGYGDQANVHEGSIILDKPYDPELIVRTLATLCASDRTATAG